MWEIELVGLEEVSVAVGVTADSDRIFGMPEVSAPQLVGRERELAVLGRALSLAPAVVLVEGEAGVGKSRLLRESLATRPSSSGRSLVGTCPPFRESLTLGPVVDAVRQACDGVAGLPLSALAGALRPLFPEWAVDLPAVPEPLGDAKASRHRLFCALAELLECLGAAVLVVEDVHWADEVSLEFLLFLTARPRPPALSVVMSYRPEDVPAGSLLLRLSSRPPAGMTQVRIALEPLDAVSTASLVSSMLDDEPVSAAFAAFLHERTDGLPLAVEESIRLMHDRADLSRKEGEWVRRSLEELQVPPTVRDAVLERAHRLTMLAQRILQAASVLAEPSPEAVICEVAGLTGEAAQDGLGEAVASGLLAEVDDRRGFTFRHALMGRAVYEAIPGPRRRRLHLTAGRALEVVAPLPVMQLTRHFREAGETSKWAEYAEHAAEKAVASNDQTTAARLLDDVLTTAALPTHRSARLAPKLARATLFRSEAVDDLNRDVVRTLRIILDSQGLNPSEQADIRNPLGRLLMQLGDWEAGYRELELAATNLSHDPVEAARVMTYLGFPLVGPWPASVHRKWLRRAGELDRSVQSPVDRIMLTADRATALLLLGDKEGWELVAGLPTTALTREERREFARANSNFAEVALWWGRYVDASRRLAIARELAESDGYSALRYGLLSVHADLDWFNGAWGSLADRLTTLLNVDADEVEPSGYGSVLRTAGWLRAAQGARDQAENHFRLALDRARLQGLVHDALEPAGGLGRLRLAEGRVDDAVQVTDDPMQAVVSKDIWVWATEIAPVRVEALLAAGKVEDASRLVARFARGLHSRNAPAPRAALATCRAILAEHQDEPARAAAAFARAARAWERLPRPYDALLARERQARCLLAADRTESGLAVLSEVFQGLSGLGARGDADRVGHHLRQCGVDARRRSPGRPSYGDQLSPRELEVVHLLVTGKTDRQIAATLYLSPKTVGNHLESARRKLKARSRTALAVAAIDAGILPDQRGVRGR